MALVRDYSSVLNSWDDLRRQARSLENDLDSKLVSLGSIGGVYDRSSTFGAVTMREEFNLHYEKYCREIEDILEKLTRVNDQMTEMVRDVQEAPRPGIVPPPNSTLPPPPGTHATAASVSGGGPASQQVHTAKRHREILRDYVQEFRQTKSKVVAARDREDLLGSVYRELSNRESSSTNSVATAGQEAPGGSTKPDPSGLHSSSTRLLLDEQDRLHRSSRMMDDHLSAAATVRAAMRAQRLALKSATASLHNLSARFPRIKHLVNAIDCRHRQDSLVLGLVIGLCVVFLLIYKLA